MLIKKVAINKSNGQKLIYVDKDSGLEVGDWVVIEKIERKEVIDDGN